MPPEKDDKSQEQAEAETTSETSSQTPPEEKTEVSDSRFEEVDFSELTDTVDNDGQSREQEKEVEAASDKESEEAEKPETADEEAEPVSAEQTKDEDSGAEETPPEETAEAAEPEGQTDVPDEVKMPTKEELKGMYDKFREDSLPVLEEMYKLTDEEAEAFDENPREVLPKIAARLHYESMMSSYNAMMAAMPSVVQQVVAARGKAMEAEKQFFGKWPDLDKPEHRDVAQAAVRSYRQMNPKAPLKEVIEKAGSLAMVNLGLDPRGTSGEKKPEPKPTPRQRPASPVSPSGSTPTPPQPAKPKDDNIFADLAEAWDKQFS